MPITWFELHETEGVAREEEPFAVGVPFPKAKVMDPSSLVVSVGGEMCPVEIISLATWGDGSLKWGLICGKASVGGGERKRFQVERSGGKKALSLFAPLEWGRFTAEAISHDARSFSLRFDRECIVRARLTCRDDRGKELKTKLVTRRDSGGGGVSQVRFSGSVGTGRGVLFTVDLVFTEGIPRITGEFTLHNPAAALHRGGIWDLGDPAGQLFGEVSLEFCVEDYQSFFVAENIGEAAGKHSGGQMARIYQDSSGGENWDSENHVNADGSRTTTFRGYRTEIDGKIRTWGLRAQPYAAVVQGERAVVTALQDFWQNFPKAITAAPEKLVISFFPPDSAFPHELQGGERKRYRFILALVARDKARAVAASAQEALHVLLDPEYVAQTDAVRHLSTDCADQVPFLDTLTGACVEGEATLIDKREIIDEYGWRNFGDLYADHEVLEGNSPAPYVTHYNNQYDLIFSFLRQYLKKGDGRWYALGRDLARHVLDIDLYHTDEDRSNYCHGLFWHTQHFLPAATATHRCYSARHERGTWYGGGPSSEHCYAGGLLHYYYLSGDRLAKEAVEKLGNLILYDLLRPRFTVERVEALARQVVARLKKFRDRGAAMKPYRYEGPGRGSGHALHVLLDAFLLTRKLKYLQGAVCLISQCINPNDDIAGRQLLNAEYRWSYTIFLQALVRFMEISEEYGEFPSVRSYARAALLAYTSWMAAYEYPFLDHPELLDAPNFATRSAQDLRKACVFFEAAVYADTVDAAIFRKRGEDFLRRSCDDLARLDTATTLRPMAIVLQNIDTLAWHRTCLRGSASKPWGGGTADPGVLREIASARRVSRDASLSTLRQEFAYLIRRFKELV